VLGRVLPDFEDRKAELARVGATIWLGAAKDHSAVMREEKAMRGETWNVYKSPRGEPGHE
jgi:hypothetical protein